MADQVSFKTRVKDTAISIAPDYYSYYVCRDYLLISDAFKNSPYYILVEENFKKNTVLCTFASSDGSCTLGFIATPSARPKTLLVGDELDHAKAKNLKIVLSKSRDDDKFSTVIAGKDEDLVNVYDSIKDLISEEINKKIVSLIPKEDAEKFWRGTAIIKEKAT